MSSKMEFVVKMTCESCVAKVEDKLKNKEGIDNVVVDLKQNTVVVESSLPSSQVFNMIKETGLKSAFRGYGDFSTAVSIMESTDSNIKGVVRFTKGPISTIIIDGTIDGLTDDKYIYDVHVCGDISGGAKTVGDCFNTSPLGYIHPNSERRGIFKMEIPDNEVNMNNIMGRSFVIKDSKGCKRAWGIIARSAGVFQNQKMICACDGKNIWNENIHSPV